MERNKRHVRMRRLMLAGCVLCLLLGVTGSISFAAFESPGQGAGAGAIGAPSVTVFDPFALRSVLVSNVSAVNRPANSLWLRSFNMRPAIRIPTRPGVRSAFRP